MTQHIPDGGGFGNPEFNRGEVPQAASTLPLTKEQKADLAIWRRITHDAKMGADMALHARRPPDMMAVPYRAENARPLDPSKPIKCYQRGWSLLRDEQAHAGQTETSKAHYGLLLTEFGKLALYNVDSTGHEPVSELNFIYKATRLIDTPPPGALLELSIDAPPHHGSNLYNLTRNLPGTTAQAHGLAAVHLSLEFFRSTLPT